MAGHNGLVGSAIVRALEAAGVGEVVGWRSSELDLTDREATMDAIVGAKPDVIIDAAAKVGGIMANSTYPVEFLKDNLLIQTNVMDAAHAADVERLLFLGSSCIYPRHATQPIRESSLMTGPARADEPGLRHGEDLGHLLHRGPPHGVRPPLDLRDAHEPLRPAATTSTCSPRTCCRRSSAASTRPRSRARRPSRSGAPGAPRREFLHVDDLAQACLMLLQKYDSPETINVGLGDDLPIKELAETVASVVGFEGTIEWDTSKPDGMPRKLLDTTRINELGWFPTIKLRDGVASTYEWYVENVA